MKLKNKVTLITGAGSGIGKAAALMLAREGAKIGALDNREGEVKETVAEIVREGGAALGLHADVSRPEQMEQAVQRLVEEWQGVDIIFANAGINGVWAPVDELEPEEWDRTMNINLKGTFLTFKYTVPYLRKQGGSAIVTSSLHGTRVFTFAGSTAYACTKTAQVTFVKKMALELAQYKVRVNVICPGSTYTHINETKEARNLEKIELPVAFPKGKIPLTGGKPIMPEDVAKLVLFLASDDSSTITGSEIWIDGAMSLMVG